MAEFTSQELEKIEILTLIHVYLHTNNRDLLEPLYKQLHSMDGIREQQVLEQVTWNCDYFTRVLKKIQLNSNQNNDVDYSFSCTPSGKAQFGWEEPLDYIKEYVYIGKANITKPAGMLFSLLEDDSHVDDIDVNILYNI